MKNAVEFKTSGESFLQGLLEELRTLNIKALHLNPDHLCFRVSTADEYQAYKELLLNQGELLTEAAVNGRPICTFKMHQAFVVDSTQVELLELPFPKEGSPYPTGFEHAEFVVKDSFASIQEQYPHLSLRAGGNKLTNPELVLATQKGQAKFHHTSLDRVIEIEKAAITDLVFDFDGTLIESREKIFEINSRVFSQVLNRSVSLEEAKEKFSPEFLKLFEHYAVTCPEKQKTAIDLWGKTAEEMTYNLFDGVHDLLHSLKAHFRLHIWTARDLESTLKTLEHHALTNLFHTVSASHLENPKPHQNSLQFNWSEAKDHSVLVIGDSPTDMHGAKNVKAIAAGAAWDPYAKAPSLIAAGAELHFSSVSELKSWLLSKQGLYR